MNRSNECVDQRTQSDANLGILDNARSRKIAANAGGRGKALPNAAAYAPAAAAAMLALAFVLSIALLGSTAGCQTVPAATGDVDTNGLDDINSNGSSGDTDTSGVGSPIPDDAELAKQYALYAQRISELPDQWRFTVARRDGQPLRDILTFEWDFGDNAGYAPSGSVQEYEYAETGVFTVEVTAYDASGEAVFTLTLTVSNSALPPVQLVADAGLNLYVHSGEIVCLDGSNSSGRDISELSFTWEQCGGVAVTLTSDETNPAAACFKAPTVTEGDKLDVTFCLTVDDGVTSAEDAVMISVTGAVSGGGGGGSTTGTDTGSSSVGTSPPTITESFENYPTGSDPAGWVDTDAGNSLNENESLFKVMAVSDGKALGTTSGLVNIHSHEVAANSQSWTSYAFSARVMITDPAGGVGLTFLSAYPQGEQYYRLRRGNFAGGTSFHIAPDGTTISGGVTDSGIVPVANVWYRLSIEAEDTGSRTEIRAKVWRTDQAEPSSWQINCWDDSATRLRTGTIGVWSMGPGQKYWDDLQIHDLSVIVGECDVDSDADGVPDCEDVCPGAADVDSDDDGILDCLDACPGQDDGQDSDGDGSPDCQDGCAADPYKTSPGVCGCGVSDADSDSDGTRDCQDGCPADPAKTQPGACGCGVADTDSDGDGTPDCQEPPPSGSAMATASRTSGIAPLAVFFSAIDASTGVVQPTSGVHADMLYEWNFGDASSGAWTTNGRSRNLATGYVAAHVYENPGTYTASLTVTNTQGQVYTYTQTINVSTFSGTTYYVSTSGSDSNSGLSTSTPLKTFDKAMTKVGQNVRILFQRGNAFTTAGNGEVLVAGPGIIGAYGSTSLPKPVIVRNGTADVFMVRGSDWRFMDLALDDGGNASSGTGINGGTGTQDRLLLLRVDIDGFSMAAWDSFYPVPIAHDQTFIVDCDFYGQGNKGVFLGGTRIALLGNTIENTDSHVVRLWHAIKSVVADNDLMDPGGEPAAVIKLHNSAQISGLPDGRHVIIADNYIRGHTWDVTIGTEDDVSYEVMRDVIVERNFFDASSTNLEIVRVNAQNVTVRNNVADLTGSEPDCRFVSVIQWGIEPPPTGARILHNSVYRGNSGGMRLMAASLADTKIHNNIAYSPAGGASIGGTAGSFIANLTQNPLWRNAAGGDFSLLSGSAAIDAGTTTYVFDDFDGSPRPVNGNGQGGAEFDIGAIEYAP